jgi:hypothetical protein
MIRRLGDCSMRLVFVGALMVGASLLSACAGRDPQPIATVQVQDTAASCLQIRAEIEANNAKVQQLANEQGWKVAQNVGAGVVGLVLWPVWFGMDFKDAAGKEAAALQARQQYLTTIATERCAAPPATAVQAPPGRPRKAPAPVAARPAAPLPPIISQAPAEPEPQLSEADRAMSRRN